MHRTFAAVATVTLLAPLGAQAFVISSPALGPGFSKDNQTSAVNGQSDLGAAASLTFDFNFTSASTATITAHLGNVGAGVITAFGFDLDDSLNVALSSFSTANANCTSVPDPGCSFSSGGTGLSGLLAEIDLSAGADQPPPKNGLANGESIDLIFNVTGSFGGITPATPFADLVELTHVIGDKGFEFDAFWVAHVQVLADPPGSDKIGGDTGNGTVVPEPGTLSLLGLGLLGAAVVARRRRKTG